jgi:thiol-disulfide isomerase/thioredoxin
MKFIFILFLIASATPSFSQGNEAIKLKKGKWIAELQLTDSDVLPFNLMVRKEGKSFSFCVVNGDEHIQLDSAVVINDSVHVRFPYFNSELVFKIENKRNISGYWQNFNREGNYKIPFTSERTKDARFANTSKKAEGISVAGKWEVEFEPNTDGSYPAVGIFEQEEESNSVTGTFLTETGDYRFLAGNTTKDSLFLSCFDGSHAFLFKAYNDNGMLKGKFFSGSHWQSEWEAKENANIELTSPNDLTYLKDSSSVAFSLKRLDGTIFNYPEDFSKNKVVIIQIMGTWCPNCLDESLFYKKLYEKYHDQGLEIISIGYESGPEFEQHVANILRLKNKLNLEFTFLVGGSARKDLASDHFDMLNEIISFPTSIYIGRDGEVKRIHTGFNGPGTGDYYAEYVKNTTMLIEYLLAQ